MVLSRVVANRYANPTVTVCSVSCRSKAVTPTPLLGFWLDVVRFWLIFARFWIGLVQVSGR